MEDYLFTLTANEVYSFLHSNTSFTLNSLPADADGIYYSGCIFSTAYEEGLAYSFRVGICYYNEATGIYTPVSYIEPAHGESFSYNQTYVSLDAFSNINASVFYGYVRNTYPSYPRYIHGYASYYAVEER